MNLLKLLTAFSVLGGVVGAAFPVGAIELISNGGFETGDFSGWDTFGGTNVLDSGFGTAPSEGTFQGYLINSVLFENDNEIEDFLGLNPGSLDTLIGGDATHGAAISQTFLVPSSGATLSFSTNFLTNEPTPSEFNDFAFFSINDSVELLADTNSSFIPSATIFNEETGHFTTTVALSPGPTTLGFGVLNTNNTFGDGSGLLVDSVSAQPIPFEMEGTLGLLTLGAIFGGKKLWKAHQQRQLAKD